MLQNVDTATPPPFSAAPQRQAIHDLRNLFAVVVSAKSLLARDPARKERAVLLDAIEDAAMRGSRLTTGLLAPGANSSPSRGTDPGARLNSLCPMMRALAGPLIHFDLKVASRPSLARIDGPEFDAALLELVANARAAGSHTIVVRARTIGSRLWFLVADDGRGMGKSTLDQARHGIDARAAHGAGLSRVHNFVRASHGSMRIRSRPSRGTSVAIILPTILSIAVDKPAPARSISLQLKEKIHEKVRQSAAA